MRDLTYKLSLSDRYLGFHDFLSHAIDIGWGTGGCMYPAWLYAYAEVFVLACSVS